MQRWYIIIYVFFSGYCSHHNGHVLVLAADGSLLDFHGLVVSRSRYLWSDCHENKKAPSTKTIQSKLYPTFTCQWLFPSIVLIKLNSMVGNKYLCLKKKNPDISLRIRGHILLSYKNTDYLIEYCLTFRYRLFIRHNSSVTYM